MPVPVVLIALVLAVAAVVYVIWPLVGRRLEGAEVLDEQRAALETEKVGALLALRELLADREAGHLTDESFAEELVRHEARVADVLRRLDALPPVAAPPAHARRQAPAAAVPWTRQPVVLGSMAFGILGFGVALGALISRNTTPVPVDGPMSSVPSSGAEAPPAFAAGPPVGGTGSGAPRPLPPEMIQGMLQAARASLEAGRYQEAIAAYKAILKRDPRNVDAITHLGVILSVAGHADGALEAFDRALSIDGKYPEALWYKASVLAEAKHDDRGAIVAWERFAQVAAAGPDRDQALERIREARARLAGGAAASPPSQTGIGAPGPRATPPPAKP